MKYICDFVKEKKNKKKERCSEHGIMKPMSFNKFHINFN